VENPINLHPVPNIFSRLKGIRCLTRSEFFTEGLLSPVDPSLNLLSLEGDHAFC
jgi:hypothetical protein